MKSERAGAVLALVLVWLAFFFPALAGQVRFPVDFAPPAAGGSGGVAENGELGDAYYAMYPWHDYLGERLRSGEVPLWDPHRFAGTPFAADIGVGTWYPPNWLYAGENRLMVFTVLAMASSLAALFVTYWFLRVHRLHPYAAAFGAVTWAFSAFLVKWATNETVVASTIWMALPLGGLEVARQGRTRRGICIAAVGLVLPVLGGHAQVALYAWCATLVWVAVTVVAAGAGGGAEHPVRRVLRAGMPAVAAMALALGMAAVQLLPAGELSAEIVRQRTTFDVARESFLPAGHLPTLLVPDYLGSPVDGNYAGPGVNYTDTAIYTGLLALPLAVLGLAHRRRSLAVFLGLLGAVGAMAATGTPPALYRFLLTLPGFDRTLSAERMSVLCNFAVAGLAALGLDRLLQRDRSGRPALAVLGTAHAAVTAIVAWLTLGRPWTPLPTRYVVEHGMQALAVLALGGVVFAAMAVAPAWTGRLALLVVALAGVDLWMSGWRFNPFHEPRAVYAATPAVDALREAPGIRSRSAEIGPPAHLPPNDALVHRHYGVGGYDPLIPRRIVELVALVEDQRDRARSNFFGPFGIDALRSPVFDLLGVDRLVGPPGLDLGPDIPPVVVGPASVYARPGAFPPAFLAPCWDVVAGAGVLPRLAGMTSEQLRTVAVVADSSAARRALGAPAAPDCAGAAPTGGATVQRYEPERVVIRTRGEEAAVLVLTDAWFPGWEAVVDGEAAPVLRVDHALRGVALPAGEHRVELRYRPTSLRTGAAMTLLTLAGMVAASALSVVARLRRRRRTGSSAFREA